MNLISEIKPAATKAVLRYRPDIDGLRAIAVIPVVLFHAGIPGFSGGFVGVDIFFVISGFLIASLIKAELDLGTFTLLGFYERRIRRIFPALFVVMAASAAVAWVLFMPEEFAYFGRSVIATAFFGSNFLFWDESGYFDATAQIKPLLHTWSLAVEEQFYIVFPLLLILISRYCRDSLKIVLAGLFLLSFGISIWAVGNAPEFAFYLAPSRAWELLAGSILALTAIPAVRGKAAAAVLPIVGLALIAIAILTFSEATPFPGLYALAPCLGAALIIHGSTTHSPINRALAWRPLVFIGLISYSLYLWHWPILVFARYWTGSELSALQTWSSVTLSAVLAMLSWRYVEMPFRRRNGALPRPALFSAAVAVVAIAAAFGLFVDLGKGLAWRLPAEVAAIYAVKQQPNRFMSEPCFSDVGMGPQTSEIREGRLCKLGAEASGIPRFILWGDSHAGAIAPGIDEAATSTGISGYFAGRASCPPLDDYDTGGSNRKKVTQCQEVNRAVLELVARNQIPLVLLVARWPKYVHEAELYREGIFFDPSKPLPLEDKSSAVVEALERTLAQLTKAGAKVALVMDVPEIGYDVPHALARSRLTGSSIAVEPSRDAVRRRQALARSVLEQAAARHGASLIDPAAALCDELKCRVERDGVVLYRDEDHLSVTGAESLSGLFTPVLSGLR